MARRILIVFGTVVAVLGAATGKADLFVVGSLAAAGAWLALNGNGGRKF